MIAAIADAASTLSFAAESSVGSGNANDAMKMDMVNPIPASSPTSPIPVHVTPSGSSQILSLTSAMLARMIPRGLPRTSASITPTNTLSETASSSRLPTRLTPAFASAKRGITPNATHECNPAWTRCTGASISCSACRSCFSGSTTACGLLPEWESRSTSSCNVRPMVSSGRSVVGLELVGVISPRMTPASVGCTPVFRRPNHTTAPGNTYA
ncbi:hypothetical protein D3C71_1250790 [compost metagenome]